MIFVGAGAAKAARRGVKHELENCDDDIKEEIVTSLAAIVREVCGEAEGG